MRKPIATTESLSTQTFGSWVSQAMERAVKIPHNSAIKALAEPNFLAKPFIRCQLAFLKTPPQVAIAVFALTDPSTFIFTQKFGGKVHSTNCSLSAHSPPKLDADFVPKTEPGTWLYVGPLQAQNGNSQKHACYVHARFAILNYRKNMCHFISRTSSDKLLRLHTSQSNTLLLKNPCIILTPKHNLHTFCTTWQSHNKCPIVSS